MKTWVYSWFFNAYSTFLDEICEDTPSEQHACSLQSNKLAAEAEKFCTTLVSKSRFVACNKVSSYGVTLIIYTI